MMMIGKRLKQFRKGRGLSQKAFADALSTSSGYISEIESGKTVPGGNFFISLKRVYSLNIDWLLSGDGEPDSAKDEEKTELSTPLDEKVVDFKFAELIKGAQDKDLARDMERDLVDIQIRSIKVFRETGTYIKGVANALRALDSQMGERAVGDALDNVKTNGQ